MSQIVVITGAGAGVGRATARAFARAGCDVGLIGRNEARLEAAAAEIRRTGRRAFVAVADVADAAAVDEAAERIEAGLGPIDIWVNNAMATVFAPVADLQPEEVRRGTEVTYLGTVHGTMSALKGMRRRGRGTIINVGSALAYRSVPLQAVYCGAKSAIRGFTDSLRSEILHDGDDIHLTMVHLPAVNTPQFDWARNRTGHPARPVPPIYEPEIPANAIVHAAFHRRREWWVGFPTVKAILANRIAPGLVDRLLAGKSGYASQLGPGKQADSDGNLFQSPPGEQQAHGRFGSEARHSSWELFSTEHKVGVLAALAALAGLGLLCGRPRRR